MISNLVIRYAVLLLFFVPVAVLSKELGTLRSVIQVTYSPPSCSIDLSPSVIELGPLSIGTKRHNSLSSNVKVTCPDERMVTEIKLLTYSPLLDYKSIDMGGRGTGPYLSILENGSYASLKEGRICRNSSGMVRYCRITPETVTKDSSAEGVMSAVIILEIVHI
ncbi:hypothetical protein OM318_23100 [Escherichia albertii]|uniref:hypothetical protein n=1 Tax=Escherichia albertii TaxID=208962 RepID=UPI000A6C7DE6|nr:hypothetical protein [Escherichia albertii]EFF0803999.1 hypothetical protein [Escherichia albertii]EFJ2289137.1 hypothetical protein [Escherichia albertii]MCU7297541.1 hypothetical protein [Escherichia albertii]MCU7306865.1 hypothetical protein [Escherichia albertii]MCZ8859329.1 hypothetical protein [Escherichia albertii]